MSIIKKKQRTGKIVVDLTSPQGNAYWLISYAHQLGDQLGLDAEKIEEEMKSGDYENLISVFDKYFGDYVDLAR